MTDAEKAAAAKVILKAFFLSTIPPARGKGGYPLPRIHPASLDLAASDIVVLSKK